MKNLLIFLSFALLFTACHSSSIRMEKDGLSVVYREKKPNGLKTIRLQVVNDAIVRVMASPTRKFASEPGLCCSWTASSSVHWEKEIRQDTLFLKTPAMTVKLCMSSGELAFYDARNRLLLQEKTGGGKSFELVPTKNDKAYSIRQVFESPEDEAIFGLGQHQSDEFNYKGKNESLYQYNTKVSVPFFVSNKGYGLLWENYSYTKWGDKREYANLDQFECYDNYGVKGALTAIYRDKTEREKIYVERREPTIDYENIETVKAFPRNIPFHRTAVSWEGDIVPAQSGDYHFVLYYAGYTKVYADGQLLVPERWRTAWNPNSYKFSLPLSAGKKHHLKVEWTPDGGVSYIGLKALSPLPKEEQERISLWSERGKMIDYYVIAGEKADDVISGYRFLTGKAQVMPKWAMGYWQSRERYKTQKELLDNLTEFRRRGIPVDNIVQDWSYWPENAWGSHEFDAGRFPNPKAMVDSVHALDARIMISVWPKFYVSTQHYREFDEKGLIYRQAVQDSIKDWIGKGYVGSFYDAYSEEARRIFWKQMEEHLFPLGFDAWWMDASEPDILSNADMTYRKALMNPTALGSSTEYFNAYGLLNAKGIYEGQRASDPNKRVFLLTRSGYAGSQRYAAAVWSGDIATRWEDMKAQIPAGLNFSISGNPYWTMDDGGFCVEHRYEKAKEGSADREEWRELNVRWHQFGCFTPIFRSHGQYPYREPWNIAPETHPAYAAMLYYNELRYRLMPYIYSLAGWCYWKDYTMMRPLMMDFGQDPNVMTISDQYMFGPSLMVCPVYTFQARTREVYFPAGCGWYDFYTGQYYEGGQRVLVPAPFHRIPLFVPAGSIIPIGNRIESTAEAQNELSLFVYAGRSRSFSLYEDAQVNYDYEKGEYAEIPIVHETNKSVRLLPAQGQYALPERKVRLVYVSPQQASGYDTPLQHLPQKRYSPKEELLFE